MAVVYNRELFEFFAICQIFSLRDISCWKFIRANRSVYTVALTVLANSVFIFSICHDITLNRTIDCWYAPYIQQGGSIVAAGMFATIVSLF